MLECYLSIDNCRYKEYNFLNVSFGLVFLKNFKICIGDIMFCANKFCVFNRIGRCSKRNVEIDATGHCKDYIYVNISSEELEKLKVNPDDETIKRIIEKGKF